MESPPGTLVQFPGSFRPRAVIAHSLSVQAFCPLTPTPGRLCLSLLVLALAGLPERRPVVTDPSRGLWAREVRKDPPRARPTPVPRASAPPRALNLLYTYQSSRSPGPRTTLSIHCRAEMSAVLRAAALVVPTAVQRAPVGPFPPWGKPQCSLGSFLVGLNSQSGAMDLSVSRHPQVTIEQVL